MLPIIILALVFILISLRQVGGVRLEIWQVMLGGALLSLALAQISPEKALLSINPDVMLFLFGMFVVGEALERSGYLSHLSYRIFRGARNQDTLLLLVLFGTGMASAFLMNDTVAVIGAPVMLHLSRKHGMNPKILLLALCFAITTGSVMSPIGNPQNLLITVDGPVPDPFVAFFSALLIPTVINLLACYFLLKSFHKAGRDPQELNHEEEPVKDERLASLSKIALTIIAILVCLKIALVSLGSEMDFRLTYIALGAAFPILAFSPSRMDILRSIDWKTLVFFASMFVLMESVWESGFFQSLLEGAGIDLASTGAILGVSLILSQFISNVPLVALYLPILLHEGASKAGLIALAAGSTIAGNLTILGAASNVIVMQKAEKAGEMISFLEFARIGIPLALINVLVYWLFLSLFPP